MGSMTENIADKAINDTRIVKQFTNPVKEPIDSDINLFDLLDNRAKRDPEGAMIEYKGDDGTWHPYSAQVFRDMVIDLAKGLVGLGVNKGDSVAIVSRTRWEWTALDMAIMSIGALTVPVYETNSASQVSWIFNDSKVTLAIAEDDGQRDKIESVRDEVPHPAQRVRNRGRRSERHQDLRRKRHRRRILGIQGSLPRRRPRHHRCPAE